MKTEPELEEYLAAVRRAVGRAGSADASSPSQVAHAVATALESVGVWDLAAETHEVENSLQWLSGTVCEIATVDPSMAYALATRYTAYRAMARAGYEAIEPFAGTAAVVVPSYAPEHDTVGEVVVATVLAPTTVVGIDLGAERVLVAHLPELDAAQDQESYSGLRGAGLVRVTLSSVSDLEDPAAAIHDWNVLTSTVLLGIARSSVAAAEDYAAGRRQFGAALTSFAAMRALLVEMRVRVDAMSALLDRALEAGLATSAASALAAEAGRIAVRTALDAIQVHGGYGYIEEYPVARHLRDAMSACARGGGRRAAFMTMAADRFGAPVGGGAR